MKKRNGFTLVELLAVITILAVIILIAVIAVLPTNQKAKNNALTDEGKSLVKSAEVAYAANQGNMLDNESVCISMEYLKQNGYYEKGISDGYEGSVLLTNQNGKLIKKYAISNKEGSIGSSSMVDYSDTNPTFSFSKSENISNCLCNQVSKTDDLNGEVKSTNGSIASGVNQVAFYNIAYNSDGSIIDNTIASNYITNLNKKGDTSLIYDGTSDNNLRYIGATPNNYVSFNNELWRIIGVMNNVKGSSTSSSAGETRVKLIKDVPIGDMVWNHECTKTTCSQCACVENEKYGNNWVGSTTQRLMDLYYESGTADFMAFGDLYKGENSWTPRWNYFSFEYQEHSKKVHGLFSQYRNYIDKATYYLGGYTSSSSTDYKTMSRSNWYQSERSGNTYNGNPTSWTGYVGLIYPSDYGYSAINSSACSTSSLYEWNDSAYSSCLNNKWIKYNQWTMTPSSNDDGVIAIFYNVDSYDSVYNYNIYPVLYLKSNVKIISGQGTSSQPYQLSI
ncbi:MAG: type II secretion system protein [Bacilli bacterium]|nr:type II secretion system protein [Bacilli bacterium]